MKPTIASVFLFFACVLPARAMDAMAADLESSAFRTGEMDPRAASVPASIRKALRADPAAGLGKLVAWLCEGAGSDFLKVKRIHDWITDNIAYDNDAFYGKSGRLPVLEGMRGTCGGFAGLLRDMAGLAGITGRVIDGYSRITFDTATSTMASHSWNAVLIGGKWYLVDATHDSRFSHEGGKAGKKSAYRDTWLFASPESKILDNYPADPADQFLAEPVSMKGFLARPLVNVYWFQRFGIRFHSDFLDPDSTPIRKERSGSGRYLSLFDVLQAGREPARIELSTRADAPIELHAELLDGSGKSVPDGAFSYLEGGAWICLFSPPAEGRFSAYISAKYLGKDTYFNKIYEFKVDRLGAAFTPLPPEGALYLFGAFERYGLSLVGHDFGVTGAKKHFLEVEFPSTTSVFSWIWDEGGDKIASGTASAATALPGGRTRVRYDFTIPGSGVWYIKIRTKMRSESLYNDTAGMAKLVIR